MHFTLQRLWIVFLLLLCCFVPRWIRFHVRLAALYRTIYLTKSRGAIKMTNGITTLQDNKINSLCIMHRKLQCWLKKGAVRYVSDTWSKWEWNVKNLFARTSFELQMILPFILMMMIMIDNSWSDSTIVARSVFYLQNHVKIEILRWHFAFREFRLI